VLILHVKKSQYYAQFVFRERESVPMTVKTDD